MAKTFLITGASRGIGKACAVAAAVQGIQVLAVARSSTVLEAIAKDSKNIKAIAADLSTQNGREKLADQINQPLDFILHNAARLDPPDSLENITVKEFHAQMAANVEPILFLTQLLLPKLKSGSRILAVSSGAAKKALLGLSNYCTSKAAAWMATEMLRSELKKHGVLVNHYFPGVVDTDMQKTLRESQDEVFEYATEFKKYHATKKLSKAEDVANDIIKVFTKTNDQLFHEEEWHKN